MDRTRIPPELMGLPPAAPPPAAPIPLGPGAMPGAMPLGAGPMPPPPMAPATPPGPALPPPPTAFPEPPAAEADPILVDLLGKPATPIDRELMKPDNKRKGYTKPLTTGQVEHVMNRTHERYMPLVQRYARDLGYYRQKNPPNVPPGFDKTKEVAFRSATLSNIVNKLTNMSSAAEWQHIVPHKDEPTRENSQIVENWYDQLRQQEEEIYAYGSGEGGLQWAEFWYLYMYGRVVWRCLPDPDDEDHPFHEALLDPGTCYPIWGDSKDGMVAMVRRYEAAIIDVLKTYGDGDPELENKLADTLGYVTDAPEWYNHRVIVWEWWDTWRRKVRVSDMWVLEEDHKLGYVPFVDVVARGEPRGVGTPDSTYGWWVDDDNNAYLPLSNREDLAQKGVSVFHHIINTHRMTEVVYTLLLSETLKSQNPAYITYSAPQIAGVAPKPIRTTPGANNQRTLNLQQVEIVPTSPRPTDTSPVLNKVQSETTEGSINPAMYGSMDGSNISGFSVESLISAAKDTTLPYTHAFTRFQALKARMRARQYISHIAPSGYSMLVPMEGKYGSKPSVEITPEIVKSTGPVVSTKMVGVSDQALPGLMNLAVQASEKGIWSRREGMEKTGVRDPSRMYRDIIVERAIEHPEIMENIIIPQMFLKNGQQDIAYMWGLLVVMPKLMQMMGGMMGGGMPPGGPPGMGGGPPGAAPPPALGPGPMNGMSMPGMGLPTPPPGGPGPGQGRGPAR